jgi:ribosomal protein L35
MILQMKAAASRAAATPGRIVATGALRAHLLRARTTADMRLPDDDNVVYNNNCGYAQPATHQHCIPFLELRLQQQLRLIAGAA